MIASHLAAARKNACLAAGNASSCCVPRKLTFSPCCRCALLTLPFESVCKSACRSDGRSAAASACVIFRQVALSPDCTITYPALDEVGNRSSEISDCAFCACPCGKKAKLKKVRNRDKKANILRRLLMEKTSGIVWRVCSGNARQES